jgi:hypothetical protein
MIILWKWWRRFREQKPQLDKAAEQKKEQRECRRRIRVARAAFSVVSNVREQPARTTLVGCFRGKRAFYADVEESNKNARYHPDLDVLHRHLCDYPALGCLRVRWAEHVIRIIVTHRAVSGRIVDLQEADSSIVRLYVASLTAGVIEDGCAPLADLASSDLANNLVEYRLPKLTLLETIYERMQSFYEHLLGGQAVLSPGTAPGSVRFQALAQFEDAIELRSEDLTALRLKPELVAIGIDRITRELVTVDFSRCFHQLLAGASRSGKTTIVNLILWQLLLKPKTFCAILGTLKESAFQSSKTIRGSPLPGPLRMSLASFAVSCPLR